MSEIWSDLAEISYISLLNQYARGDRPQFLIAPSGGMVILVTQAVKLTLGLKTCPEFGWIGMTLHIKGFWVDRHMV